MEDTSGFGRCLPIAKEFSALGFKVKILALHPNFASLTNTRENINGVEIHYVGQMHVKKVANKKFYFPLSKLLLVVIFSTWHMFCEALKDDAPIIYCFKPQPINGLVAISLHFLKKRTLLLDCDDYEAASSALTGWQRQIIKLFEDKLPQYCHRITCNTFFTLNRYLALGHQKEKFIYIPDGIDWDRLQITDSSKIEGLRQTLGLTNKRVILYFGAITQNFGHAPDLLIKSFPLIKNEIPNAKLLITGGGDAFEKMKKLVDKSIEDDVIFTGRLSFEELPYYLKLGEISVDPIRNDPANQARCALKVIESIALEIPVVTSDVGDRRKTLADGKAGILIEPDNIDALAKGIIKILKDASLKSSMIKICRQHKENYHWKKLVAHIIENTPYLKHLKD